MVSFIVFQQNIVTVFRYHQEKFRIKSESEGTSSYCLSVAEMRQPRILKLFDLKMAMLYESVLHFHK